MAARSGVRVQMILARARERSRRLAPKVRTGFGRRDRFLATRHGIRIGGGLPRLVSAVTQPSTRFHPSARAVSRFRPGMRGDPFLGGLVKSVTKVLAPVTKIVNTVTKIPVVGPLITKVGLKAVPIVGPVITAAQVASMAGGTVAKIAGRVAAGGSKITKGPLTLGGKQLLPGPVRPGVGAFTTGALALGAGAGIGRLLRPSHSPGLATQAQPSRRAPSKKKAAKSSKKCCPSGTKRMVCFKRGRVKPRGKKKSARGKSLTAHQRRFAALARKHGGRIPKGSRV